MDKVNVYSVETFDDEFEVWNILFYTDSFDTAKQFVEKFMTELYNLDGYGPCSRIRVNKIAIYKTMEEIMRDSPHDLVLDVPMRYKYHYNGDTHEWESCNPNEVLYKILKEAT